MGAWSRFVDTFFKWDVIERYFPAIAKGMVVTIEVAVAVVITGILLGLAIAVLRSFRVRVVNVLIVIFVDVFRALPPLVLVLLVFFGLPNLGINLPSFLVLWLVLALVLAAFAEEIFWAGILSIPKGQWEAARSTGLSSLGTLTYVILTPGDPPDGAAAHQPHHRHYQEYRARHRDRRRRNPQSGHHRASVLRQRDATDDGRDCLFDFICPGGRARPLP